MGPLQGIKIIEMAGIGPGPFCAMLLSDMGADIVRIDRKGASDDARFQALKGGVLNRGRRSIALDLRKPEAVAAVLRLVKDADALIEGYRPGVMERLGLGPDRCLEVNPRLVYGRMTGWGQEGPLAQAAGHDINYIALSGALHAIGSPDAPTTPLNLLGDFGGGAMLLGFGLVCALLEAQRSRQGQVVDAAMTDGTALLMAMIYSMKAAGYWRNERGRNILDGGAHFYSAYRCADGKWVAIGAIEPQFYRLLLEQCGIDDPTFLDQWNTAKWPDLKQKLAAVIATKTRAEWCALLEGSDVCFAPVLDLDEAPKHPHNRSRGTFIKVDGVIQPAPAPRFSRTPGHIQAPPATPGQHTETALADWGFSAKDIAALRRSGAI